MLISFQKFNIKISQQETKFMLFLYNIQYVRYTLIESINWIIRHAIYNPNDNVWTRIVNTFVNFNKNSFHLAVKIIEVISQRKSNTL